MVTRVTSDELSITQNTKMQWQTKKDSMITTLRQFQTESQKIQAKNNNSISRIGNIMVYRKENESHIS